MENINIKNTKGEEMRKRVYFNKEDMGLFEVEVIGDKLFIERVNKEEDRFMSVSLKGTNAVVFVNQQTERALPTGKKIKSSDIGKYISFDISMEQVIKCMRLMMEKG